MAGVLLGRGVGPRRVEVCSEDSQTVKKTRPVSATPMLLPLVVSVRTMLVYETEARTSR